MRGTPDHPSLGLMRGTPDHPSLGLVRGTPDHPSLGLMRGTPDHPSLGLMRGTPDHPSLGLMRGTPDHPSLRRVMYLMSTHSEEPFLYLCVGGSSVGMHYGRVVLLNFHLSDGNNVQITGSTFNLN